MTALYILAVPAGLLIGLSLGALGGGGSILTVPALVYVLGQSAHGAATASLVIVGVTSLAGMAAHARAGRVRFGSGLIFGGLGTVGSLVGARLSAGVNSDVLLAAFAVLVLIAAAAMLARARRTPTGAAAAGARPRGLAGGQPADDETPTDTTFAAGAQHNLGKDVGHMDAYPEDTGALLVATRERTTVAVGAPAGPNWRKGTRVVIAASVVGLLTGFFGVGGGFVVVPALVLALRFQMPEAVGTSLLVIAINSASALLGRIGTHVQLNWALVGVFIAAAVAGTLVGNRVASSVRPERLAIAFTWLLVAVAIYTAARSVSHLA